MLFQLHADTPKSKVFTGLNDVLKKLVRMSLHRAELTETVFTDSMGKSCWENPSTRKKMEALWEALKSLPDPELASYSNAVQVAPDPLSLFGDIIQSLPIRSTDAVEEKLNELATHMYRQT